MKKTLHGWLVQPIGDWPLDRETVTWVSYKPARDSSLYRAIRPQSIEVDVPDDFDPTAAQIAALRTQQDALRSRFIAQFDALEDRIQKLQALPCEVQP